MLKKRNNFEDLLLWQKSIKLSKRIYEITEKFPAKENFGLTQQIRRSAVSIASNIAEGSERASKKEFIQFLSIAKGSYAELRTQIIISLEVGYINKNDFEELIILLNEISIFLTKLINSLKNLTT